MTEAMITKYRPQELDEVVGQDGPVRALSAAIQKGTGHAFLFSGPSGVGKTTMARIAAKAFRCEEILEEDGATNTGIDNIRGLIDGIVFRPLNGASKAI